MSKLTNMKSLDPHLPSLKRLPPLTPADTTTPCTPFPQPPLPPMAFPWVSQVTITYRVLNVKMSINRPIEFFLPTVILLNASYIHKLRRGKQLEVLVCDNQFERLAIKGA